MAFNLLMIIKPLFVLNDGYMLYFTHLKCSEKLK